MCPYMIRCMLLWVAITAIIIVVVVVVVLVVVVGGGVCNVDAIRYA